MKTVSVFTILWSFVTRVKIPAKSSLLLAPSSRFSKDYQSARLSLILGCIAPGLAFGVLILVGGIATFVPPGTIVPSVLVAAVASLLAGLCLAELVTCHCSLSIVPCNLYGSFYQWLGEGSAFTTGWISIIHQSAAAAVVFRLQSFCLDALTHGALSRSYQYVGLSALGTGLWDPASVVITLSTTLLLILPIWKVLFKWDPKPILNAFLVMLSLTVALMFIAMVALNAPHNSPPPGGTGTWEIASRIFASERPSGLLCGAALFTYAFIGQHSFTEGLQGPLKPAKDLPIAIGISTGFGFVTTFALAAVVTLQQQRNEHHMMAVVVETSSATAIITSLSPLMTTISLLALIILGCDCLSKVAESIRCMAYDGLMFRGLVRSKMCWMSAAALLVCLLAVCNRISLLLALMALGPLLLNSIICMTVLVTRFHPPSPGIYDLVQGQPGSTLQQAAAGTESTSEDDDEDIDDLVREHKERFRVASLPNLNKSPSVVLQEPTQVTARRADLCATGIFLSFVLLALIIELGARMETTFEPTLAIISSALTAAICCFLFGLYRQPQTTVSQSFLNGGKAVFQIPMVPWLPALGLFLNLSLLIDLLTTTWLVFLCWSLLGIAIYICYGVHHSTAATTFPLNNSPCSEPPLRVTLGPFPHNTTVPQIVPSHQNTPTQPPKQQRVNLDDL